jgi:hypothetical protein
MQKEFEKQEKLKALDEERRMQMVKDMEEQAKKHKQHEPVTILVYTVLSIFGLRSLVSYDRFSKFMTLQSPKEIDVCDSCKFSFIHFSRSLSGCMVSTGT